MVDALLAADEREIGIGREEEVGLGVVLQVVLDVGHARLLVGADHGAQGVGERLAGALDLTGKECRRVEGHHERALVVLRAAAQQVALAARYVERVHGPAQAQGHDVGVADGGHVLAVGARHVAKSQIALAIGGLEAQAVGDGQRAAQGLRRCRAKGLAGLGVLQVLHRLHLHERADVLHHVVPDLVDVRVYAGLEFRVVRRGLCVLCHVLSFLVGM